MKKPSIADNFFFAKVMQDNPDLCLYLIKLIIQDDLQDLDDVQMEKYIKSLFEAHAIQMDVLTVTDDTIIDLEMQKRYQKFLAKRMRFYGSCVNYLIESTTLRGF